MAGDSPPPPPPPPSPPPVEQPDPKRQKMSTTTSDEEIPENAAAIPRTPKYKRRKVAIFFAYCGVGYQGMQKNPGAKTIEGDFEEALFFAGGIPEDERGMHRRFDWARSARTDKGVSAVGQVVSGKFYVDPPGFIERLNSHLAPQIRVFGYNRATPSFNAKKFCDRRRYVYLVPVFALDPSCHRDRESVMASVGSGNELVKCVECSERGRKVFGIMGKRCFEKKTVVDSVEVGSGISSNNGSDLAGNKNVDSETGTNDSEQNTSIENGNVVAPKIEESERVKEDNDETGILEDKIVLKSSEIGNHDSGIDNASDEREDKMECDDSSSPAKMEEKSEFCFGEAEKERFNRILKYYEGTHNFHNFTTRTKAEDPAAKRYILSFNANTVLNIGGIEFIKCEVVGQSFMLHQIRKMIGLAVAIMRNCSDESLVVKAFEQKVNINVPMAPEVGLYLDECFFSSYNHRWKDTHEELSMKPYAEEAEAFKMKYIYPHVASTEHKDGAVAVWLHSLNYRNYPDLRPADSTPILDEDKVVENCPASEQKSNEPPANSTPIPHGDKVVENCQASEQKNNALPAASTPISDGDKVVENCPVSEAKTSDPSADSTPIPDGDKVVENCPISEVKNNEPPADSTPIPDGDKVVENCPTSEVKNNEITSMDE